MANLATVKQKAATADAQQGTGGLLTKKVDAAAKGLLAKKVNPNQQWQVILVADKSYSMEDEYRRGTVQEVIERTLGFALIVDDDGTVPAVFFGGNIADYTVQLNDFNKYVKRNRIRPDGSTPLTGALERVAQITGNGDLVKSGGLFSRSEPQPSVRKMDTPAYVVIVTDGRPNEPQTATDLIRRLSYRGLFLKFIYVGNDRAGWKFLESLDDDIPVGKPYDQGGRLIDNVDAKNLGSSISSLSDQDFYEAMFDEAGTWLSAARSNGLI